MDTERIFNTLNYLSLILPAFGLKMRAYATDLIYAMPKCLDAILCGRKAVLFIGSHHAETPDRFLYAGSTLEEQINECRISLGMDYMVELDDKEIILTNYKLTDMEMDDIVRDLRHRTYREITLIDKRS